LRSGGKSRRHTSAITVTLAEHPDGSITLRVADDGPGVDDVEPAGRSGLSGGPVHG
jgi:signal transduction histidine kinase